MLLPRCTLALSLLLWSLPGLASAADPTPPPAPTPETFVKAADSPVDVAHEKALYTVGYAHLDTQWRWTYPQVIREYLANTLHDNFRLLDKYPNYVFNFSGSRRYEMMREYYPADYEKLKTYVAAGRWFPCGSSVDEDDANVPALEAMVRHVLYGNHYFQREFGVVSHEFMLPDCFGFPASLPSILAHCGLKGFSTQKLTWGSAAGIPFKVGRWVGPDGKEVVAALDPGSYNGGISEDLSRNAGWLTRINKTGELSGVFADYHYYGTGDKGGAPREDSVRGLERSVAGKGPVRVVSATAQRLFDDLSPAQAARLPAYKGELLLTEHSAGSITSQAYMKRWNRKNELLADAAERAAVTARLLGGAPYPGEKLYSAWDLLLGSQMHDMLPGTSVPKAYEYCWNDELLAANQFAAVETDAVGAVASGLDTRAQGVPLVVYNPLAQERDDVVEATVLFPGDAPAIVGVFGPDGTAVPAQIDRRDGHSARLLFPAHLPSVGFAAFDVRPLGAENVKSPLKVSTRGLENERYRVTLDAGGDVASIFDKANQQEILAAPARLEFHYEKPRQFPAWNMDWEDRQLPAKAFVDGPAKIRVVENGPVRVALEVEREAQGSRFVQTIRLSTGAAGDRVEFANVIDWQTRESSLKASFPFKNASPLASYDDKLGVSERGNNDPKKYEVPQHQWFDVTNGQAGQANYGAAVLNDSKFGSDKPDDRTLRLTLLYTPGIRTSYPDQGTQDFGRHEMLYAVAGHAGDWRAGGVPGQAARLNQPLAAFQTTAHDGQLGRSFSLLRLGSDQVAVVAVKQAEDSDEVVVRLKETTGRPANDVTLTGALPITAAREVNGQEQPLGSAALRGGALTTELGPFGLRAFALKFAPAPAPLATPKSQPVELAYDLDAFSTQRNRADGGFDAAGRTYPAEQLPAHLTGEGVEFRLGPTTDGQKNALACHGQTVSLPAGDFDHVYLLAAAADGDARGTFKIGDHAVERTVQDWSAYLGQWDNRLWRESVPEDVVNCTGLVPGYTKRDPVAWYASHRHHPQDGNEFYQYCYLFKYGFDLPAGTRTVTLPDNPRLRVFAVSVARDNHEGTFPARPLYDTLDDHSGGDVPRITPGGGRFDDATTVALAYPLYWTADGLRYTLDGSEPTAQSPVYHAALRLDAPTTVRTRMLWPDGHVGPVATSRFEINDTTPPKLAAVTSLASLPQVRVTFSEPVRKDTAEAVGNYQFAPPVNVLSARLAEDGVSVDLGLAQPLGVGGGHRLTVGGVQDLAPAANRMLPASADVSVAPAVYSLASLVCDGHASREEKVAGLPVAHADAWTVNLFVRTDQQPDNHTLIAGFGAAKDEDGHGRYLSKFANGIHFWGSNRDVETNTPLTPGAWQMLTATYDGHTLTLYKDAQKIGEETLALADDDAVVQIAPLDPWDHQRRFEGEIRQFTVWKSALSEGALRQLHASHP